MGNFESPDSTKYQNPQKKILKLKEVCVICLEPMIENVVWLPCAHCYHSLCIEQWENNCKKKNREITCCLCDYKY